MNASIVVIVFKFEDAAIYPTNGSILRREEPAGMRDLGSGIELGSDPRSRRGRVDFEF